MKRIILFIAGSLLLSFNIFAQQDAQYSMYMFNGMAINPAYAGSRERPAITALYRHQWAGIAGAPKTFTLTGHAPLLNDRIGLGGSIASDNIGVLNLITMSGSFAYRIKFSNGSKLSAGMSAVFNNFRQRFSEITTTNENDPNFSRNISVFSPNFGAGLFYYSDRYYVGVSIPHLLNASINESGKFEGTDRVARQYRHYFVTAGYVIDAGENLKIKPSVMYKYVNNTPSSLEPSVGFLIKEALWLGASYRMGFGKAGGGFGSDAVIGMVEYVFQKNLRIGYAYDFTVSQLNNYTSGSHEIMLGYEFGKKETYLTPRRMSYF